jgi:hypothetical protein
VSAITVLPALNAEWAHACCESMHADLRIQTLVVDNTRDGLPDEPIARWVYRDPADRNVGVAASWNVGLDLAESEGANWLIVISEAIRFGETGGLDLLDALSKCEVANYEQWFDGGPQVTYPIVHANEFGWHLQAIARPTWERVGAFDPIFKPAYFEDTDYLYRMGLAGLPSPRENGGQFHHVTLDASDLGNGHSLSQRLVEVRMGDLEGLYVAKWGGRQGHETFTHPYNDRALDWTHVGGPNAD